MPADVAYVSREVSHSKGLIRTKIFLTCSPGIHKEIVPSMGISYRRAESLITAGCSSARLFASLIKNSHDTGGGLLDKVNAALRTRKSFEEKTGAACTSSAGDTRKRFPHGPLGFESS